MDANPSAQSAETADMRASFIGPLPRRFPPSANGYLLIDDRGRTHHATWAAPYFVFVGADNPEDEPLGLVHCDDLAHAIRVASHGGTILNHDLTPRATPTK